jgi:hypothetical protein
MVETVKKLNPLANNCGRGWPMLASLMGASMPPRLPREFVGGPSGR